MIARFLSRFYLNVVDVVVGLPLGWFFFQVIDTFVWRVAHGNWARTTGELCDSTSFFIPFFLMIAAATNARAERRLERKVREFEEDWEKRVEAHVIQTDDGTQLTQVIRAAEPLEEDKDDE